MPGMTSVSREELGLVHEVVRAAVIDHQWRPNSSTSTKYRDPSPDRQSNFGLRLSTLQQGGGFSFTADHERNLIADHGLASLR